MVIRFVHIGKEGMDFAALAQLFTDKGQERPQVLRGTCTLLGTALRQGEVAGQLTGKTGQDSRRHELPQDAHQRDGAVVVECCSLALLEYKHDSCFQHVGR